MSAITASLSGDQLPPIERQFVNTPIENATDVVTLDGTMYTDFISQHREWVFNYSSVDYADYNLLKAKYDAQFTNFEYPELTIDFYSISAVPVRMYINEKDIQDNCGNVANVQIRFRETRQMTYTLPDYILLDNDEVLLMNGSDLLVQ